MSPDADEFGVPIKKKQSTELVDEYGVPVKKKSNTEPTSSSNPLKNQSRIFSGLSKTPTDTKSSEKKIERAPYVFDNKPKQDNVSSGAMKQTRQVNETIAKDNVNYLENERPKEIEAKAAEIKKQSEKAPTQPAFDGIDFMKQDIIKHGGGESLKELPTALESLNLYFDNDATNAADYFNRRKVDIDNEIKDLTTAQQAAAQKRLSTNPLQGDINTGIQRPQFDANGKRLSDNHADEEKATFDKIRELKDYKSKLEMAQNTLAKKYVGWMAKDATLKEKGKLYGKIMGDEYSAEIDRLESKGIPTTQEQQYNTEIQGLEVAKQELNDEYAGRQHDQAYYEKMAHLEDMDRAIMNKFPEFKRQQGGNLIAQLATKDSKLKALAETGSGDLDKEMKDYLETTYGVSKKDLKGLEYGDIPSENMYGNIAKGITDAAAGLLSGVTRIAGTAAGVDEDRLTHINQKISSIGANVFGDNPYEKLAENPTIVNRDLKTIDNPNYGRYNYNAATMKNAIGTGIGGLIGFIGGTKGVGKVLSLSDDAAMTSYLIGSGFEHNYQNANNVMGKDASEFSKGLYATGMGYLEALAFKVLPKDKIFFGSAQTKAAEKELAKSLEGVTINSINREALESGFTKVLKAAVGTTEETAKIGGAMTIAEMAKTATNVLLGKDEQGAELIQEGVGNIGHIVRDLPFSMGIPLGLMEIPKFMKHSNRTKQTLFDAGLNPETYTSTIRQAQEKGIITPEQADKRIEVVETMANVIKSMPDVNPKTGEKLTQSQQVEYAYNRVKEIAVKSKGAEIKDEALAPFYKKEAKELVDERTAIVTGTEAEYKAISDIYDRAYEKKNHKTTLDAGTKTEGVKYLSEQALTTPNSFKNQSGNDAELTTDLIARNPSHEIKAEIKSWKEKLDPEATKADNEAIQKHIDLLEVGLEKQRNPKVEEKPVDTKLSEPIEGLDPQGIPIGENVPPPTETKAEPPVPDTKPTAVKPDVTIPVKLDGKEIQAKYLEDYKGQKIVEIEGDVYTYNPKEEVLFKVALDDSTGNKRVVPEANNVKSAKEYIDWSTKTREENTKPTTIDITPTVSESKGEGKANNVFEFIENSGFKRDEEANDVRYNKDGVTIGVSPNKLNPFNKGSERMPKGEKGFTINIIAVDPSGRGKGVASKALKEITDYADKNGETIYLSANDATIGFKKGLDKKQLEDWYSRHGFKKVESIMIREPKEQSLSTKPEIKNEGKEDKLQQSTETKSPTEEVIGEATQGAGSGKEPPKEPTKPVEEGGKKKDLNDKGVLNHLVSAENVPEAAKNGFKEKGLKYETASQKEAEDVAKSIIDEYGVKDAVLLADAQKFDGDVNSLIYAESLNRLAKMEAEAKTPQERLEFAKEFAEVGIRYDEAARKGGRFTSAINYFYKKSPLGVQMIENAKRKEQFEEWSKPKDKSWKEFFDEMMKEPEFEKEVSEKVKEEMKKERAEARKERIKKVDEFFDKAKDQFKGGATYSTIIPPQVITAAIEGMKQAYHAGEKVVKLIEDAVDYISEKLGNDTWDKEKFRKEWSEKLKEKESKKPLTDEEIKAKVLDRFRKKLKGLTDKEKEEVVRKAFQKIVESGGLDYADFKKIISDITGRGELTADEAARLKKLVEETNTVDDAAKKAQSERTQQSLDEFYKVQTKAAKASKELNELLYNKPNIIKRLTSIMQLNTLGIPALVNNPVYNIWNQTTLRMPVGLVKTGVDAAITGVGKMAGKDIPMETNILNGKVQLEFFKKLGLGLKESATQFFTGLNRADYTAKEIQGDQIRPATAWRDLISNLKGKKHLSGEQKVDKWIQATAGVPAEVVARTLNLGDKPQRFAAEGAQAAAFAKALGLKDIDYNLFIEFPREEAYAAYKKKGLSDADAAKKADYVKDTIIKEGQRSTFQQDNMLNDVLNKIFGGEKSGVGSFVKAATISPYIKIPSNAYWSYYNLVNPEIAFLQSMIYGGKAALKQSGKFKRFVGDKDNTSAAKDLNEAKYWFAHGAVGIAARAVVMSLVGAGIARTANTGDDTKKEREGEQYYEQQGTINVSKLMAAVNGEDPNKVTNGLNVQMKWFGHWGTLANAIAKKQEDMTPEQKEKQDEFWAIAFGGMETDALKDLNQGVFSNTSSLLTSVEREDFKSYGVNLINMMTNIVQPATIAQMTRASMPYYTKQKADTFLGELNNSLATRSGLYRKLSGTYPPTKVGIWGDKLEKKDNFPMRLFGISRANPDNFAQVIYEDVKRTDNIAFLPPSVKPEIRGNGEIIKLPTKDAARLEELVGQQRKNLAAPYVNDMATFEGSNKKYSELSDEEKLDKLAIIYEEGFKNGKEIFLKENPKYIIPAKTREEKSEDKKDSRSNKKFRKAIQKR